jgi:hypothetical protein
MDQVVETRSDSGGNTVNIVHYGVFSHLDQGGPFGSIFNLVSNSAKLAKGSLPTGSHDTLGLLCTTSCDKSTNPMQKSRRNKHFFFTAVATIVYLSLLHGVC